MLYVPDNAKFKNLPRGLLLSIIYHTRRELFNELVAARDTALEARQLNNYDQLSISITEEFKNAVLKLPELKGNMY